MKKIEFANLAVFVLFFGLALMEAIQNSDWLTAVIFVALGLIFLWADLSRKS